MKKLITRLNDLTYTANVLNLRENNPEYIVVHSTFSYPNFSELLKAHKRKGWDGIGYHCFVSKDGTAYLARPLNKEGAHAWGFNFNSIGLCIYSNNGKPSSKNIETGREVICDLQSIYHGNLSVISHTFAQVKYINQVLKKAEINLQFPEIQEIVREENFNQIKRQFNSLAGQLSTAKYGEVKGRLKSFKNCPGRWFEDLIRQLI